ncbi:MAG: hypothetical protein AAGC96_02160 [Pseudomonadota bacterium]
MKKFRVGMWSLNGHHPHQHGLLPGLLHGVASVDHDFANFGEFLFRFI